MCINAGFRSFCSTAETLRRAGPVRPKSQHSRGASMKFTTSLIAMAVLGAFLALSVPAQAQDAASQQRFQRMQTMMDQAGKAKPADRQHFMADHTKLMREQINSMRPMMGQGGMMGQPQTGAPPEADKGYQMMQQRMDMMQQMMDQMIQMQQLMLPPAK
jgi:hypothetical protein